MYTIPRFQADKLRLANLKKCSDTQLHFNQVDSAIDLSKSLLSLSLEQPTGLGSQVQQDYEAPQASASASDFSDVLRQLLPMLLRDGYPEIGQVANAAGMSVRSLQRRLAEEHLSYSRLIDQARFEVAVRLLQDPTIQLIDIALELGYTDAANFTRAFRRWTGGAPRQFRHSKLQC
jgi:AraC-like DNA-binding protein